MKSTHKSIQFVKLVIHTFYLVIGSLSYIAPANAQDSVLLEIERLEQITQNQWQSALAFAELCKEGLSEVLELCKIIDQLLTDEDPRLPELFDDLSPTAAFSIIDNALLFSQDHQKLIGARIQTVRDQNRNKKLNEAVSSSESNNRLQYFASSNSSDGKHDGAEFQPDSHFDALILVLGIDYKINDNQFVGASLGAGSSDLLFPKSAGKIESDSRVLSLFGTWSNPNIGYLDVALNFHKTQHELQRSIEIIGEKAEIEASPRTSVQSLSFGFGRDHYANDWIYGVKARAVFSSTSLSDYTELATKNGLGQAAENTVVSPSVHSQQLAVGGRIGRFIRTDNLALLPEVSFTFQSDNDKDVRYIDATNVSSKYTAHYLGTPRNEGYISIDIGLHGLIKQRVHTFIYYNKIFQHNSIKYQAFRIGITSYF